MTVKEEAIQALSSLPDNVEIEEMMYRLYVLEKIHQGEQDILEGRVISNEQLLKEIESW